LRRKSGSPEFDELAGGSLERCIDHGTGLLTTLIDEKAESSVGERIEMKTGHRRTEDG